MALRRRKCNQKKLELSASVEPLYFEVSHAARQFKIPATERDSKNQPIQNTFSGLPKERFSSFYKEVAEKTRVLHFRHFQVVKNSVFLFFFSK